MAYSGIRNPSGPELFRNRPSLKISLIWWEQTDRNGYSPYQQYGYLKLIPLCLLRVLQSGYRLAFHCYWCFHGSVRYLCFCLLFFYFHLLFLDFHLLFLYFYLLFLCFCLLFLCFCLLFLYFYLLFLHFFCYLFVFVRWFFVFICYFLGCCINIWLIDFFDMTF